MNTRIGFLCLGALTVAAVTAVAIGHTEQAKVVASDGASGDELGSSVAISGDIAICGAPFENEIDDGAGAAYIYSRDEGGSGNWGEVIKLLASNGGHNDRFGTSVAIEGDTAVVGCASRRIVYVFYKDEGGTDAWGEVATLTPFGGAGGDDFGSPVAISGDTIVVGAVHDNDKGTHAGAAYVFGRDEGGSDNWGEVDKLVADDGFSLDNFGAAVAVSGDTVIIGANLEDQGAGLGSDLGSAYIFVDDSGWTQVAKIVASDGDDDDSFGSSVSIDGDTAGVGAPGDDDDGSGSGSAYVFYRDQGGADNWGQVAKLTAMDAAAGDSFGSAVSVSLNNIVVGAHGDDDNGSGSGSAYVFSRDKGSTDGWGQTGKLVASDGGTDDAFARSVAIDANTIIAGAPGDDDVASGAGAAYISLSCVGDFNNDGVTDVIDYSVLLSNFGTSGHDPYTEGDCDGDGDVDIYDNAAFGIALGCGS